MSIILALEVHELGASLEYSKILLEKSKEKEKAGSRS